MKLIFFCILFLCHWQNMAQTIPDNVEIPDLVPIYIDLDDWEYSVHSAKPINRHQTELQLFNFIHKLFIDFFHPFKMIEGYSTEKKYHILGAVLFNLQEKYPVTVRFKEYNGFDDLIFYFDYNKDSLAIRTNYNPDLEALESIITSNSYGMEYRIKNNRLLKETDIFHLEKEQELKDYSKLALAEYYLYSENDLLKQNIPSLLQKMDRDEDLFMSQLILAHYYMDLQNFHKASDILEELMLNSKSDIWPDLHYLIHMLYEEMLILKAFHRLLD